MNDGKSRNDKGNGTIYHNEKRDRWEAAIQWTDKSGVSHRKKFSSSKQNVVKTKMKEFKRQLIIDGGDVSKSDVTFREFSEYWLKSILKDSSKKPTSYMRKEVTLENQVYPYLGSIPINEISLSDVQSMVNSLVEEGKSFSTIKKAYEAVNGCIRYYRIKNKITFNPCEGVALPLSKKREDSDIVFFTPEQCALIIQESRRKYKNGAPVYRLGSAYVLLLSTGMRIGELLALEWGDVNFDNRTITINKNSVVYKDDDGRYSAIIQNSPKTYSGNRVIPMSQKAYDALKELQEVTGKNKTVLTSLSGGIANQTNINRRFHSILLKSGVAKNEDDLCGVHSLRHTFASLLFKKGCDVKVISEILGHSDTKITENIYIHLIQQQKATAIENIDKYDI